MPVPQRIASAEDPLRHHGYSRCSAPLQQAQVLECVGAQRRGILQSSKTNLCSNRHRLNSNHQWPPLLSPPLLQADIRQTFVQVCSLNLSIAVTSAYSTISLSPPFLLPPVNLISSYLLLLIFFLLLSPSPSRSYSCCHPHRTSQKCEDSGCWATLPYYWSFTWKPCRATCDWLSFQRGGAAEMLYDHMSLYACFVQINMSFKWSPVLLVSSNGNEMLLYLTHQGHGSIAQNTTAWFAERMWSNWVSVYKKASRCVFCIRSVFKWAAVLNTAIRLRHITHCSLFLLNGVLH